MIAARTPALVVLVACGYHHAAVMPNLSAVPADRRDDIIQSSLSRPSPENQPATAQGRSAETFAATVAAVLGIAFSQDDNASIGAQWIDVDTPKRPRAVPETRDDANTNDTAKPADGAVLVPWVQLKPH